MTSQIRTSRKRLEELERTISERDYCILRSLQKCRYLTTGQITRLHFNNSTTHGAAIRAANRGLAKLKDYGLIGALTRRIGGVRAGSGSFVWALTPTGFKLLHLEQTDAIPRKQFREPTPYFLEHTLLVSETHLQLTEICGRHDMTLASVLLEPECWRWYQADGKKLALKPDLFAATQANGYEDCWFIEIDRATETPARVLDKCDRYIHYLRSGAEQRKTGVFPYVVWIVPSKKRENAIRTHIAEAYVKGPDIFITITPDEFETLIVGGAVNYLHKTKSEGVSQ
jgi:hypothetical protein